MVKRFILSTLKTAGVAFLAIAFVFTVVGVADVATAPTAEAGFGPGGKVTLKKSSTGNLKVSAGLKRSKSGKSWVMLKPIGWIAPGQNTKTHAHMKDADAFLPPKGCKTYVGSGGRRIALRAGVVVKVRNMTHHVVTVTCPKKKKKRAGAMPHMTYDANADMFVPFTHEGRARYELAS